MGKTVADYPDAVRRIVETDVPVDATTQAEVRRALSTYGGAQVNAEDRDGNTVADNVADQIVTEDRLVQEFEAAGVLPSESDISKAAQALDDYDFDGRAEAVAEATQDRVATVEDVERAVSERREQARDRPTFREDVEGAVDSVSQDKEFVGQSEDAVADQKARETGAPSRTEYQRQAAQTVAQADTVNPSEVVEDTGSETPVQIIRSESGEAVAATGGPGGEVSQQVADEIGAEYLSAEEVTGEMRTAGSGDSVDLTLRGRKIGEVDV